MHDPVPSRRALLRCCVAGVVATTAGCLGGDDAADDGGNDTDDGSEGPNGGENGTDPGDPGDGGENGTDDGLAGEFELAGSGAAEFRDWLVPETQVSTVGEVELVTQYNDFAAAAEAGVAPMIDERASVADTIRLDQPERLSAELLVGPPEVSASVLFGEFDADAVVAAFTEAESQAVAGEYGGYTVVENTTTGTGIAIGSDAVVRTPAYEAYIDAAAGETQRLGGADPDAGLLFDLLPAGYRTAVSYHPNLEDVAVNGEVRTAYEDGSLARSVRALVFEDESAATPERGREILNAGRGYGELFTEEQHGRVVMVEYAPPE